MGNEEGGLPCPAGLEVVQNDLLGAGVHGRDGIVQNQDGRVLEQGAGNGDALLLAAGNGHAALAQHGLITVFKVHDVVTDVRQRGSTVNVLPGSVIHTEPDVMGDGVREEEVVLRDIGAGVAHRVDGNGVDVFAIHKQGAVRHVVGTEQQVYQSGLARARLAHDAHSLAGLDREADVFEHIELAVRVAERQVPEFHTALHIGQIRHAGTVSHINGGIQQLGDAVEGRLATGGFFNEHGHGHDGPDDGLKVTDVLHQLARVELPDVDKIAAKTQDHADDRLHKQGDHDLQQHRDAGILHVDLLVFLVELPERDQLFQFLDKGLDDRDAGEILLREV